MAKRVRERNVVCDVKKLDEDIKAVAGDLYSRSNISMFVIGKARGYYNVVMSKQRISEIALNKVCKYYHLNKEDYIIKPELTLVPPSIPFSAVEEEPNNEVVTTDSTNSEILEKLSKITEQLEAVAKSFTKVTSVLGTCYAEEKSMSYLLSQLHDKLSQHCKNEKEMLDKLEQNTRYSRNRGSRRIG